MLMAQLDYKSKSLAEATMMNITRNEFLTNLITELEELMDNQKVSKAKSRLILQHIRENISQEDQWQVFQENFDLIHKDFFKLKELYPQLTPPICVWQCLSGLTIHPKKLQLCKMYLLEG